MVKEYYVVKDSGMKRYIYAAGKELTHRREDAVDVGYTPYLDPNKREILNLKDVDELAEELREKMKSGEMNPKRNSLVHLVDFSDDEVAKLRAIFKSTRIQSIPERSKN